MRIMRDHLAKIVIVALVVLIVGVPVGLRALGVGGVREDAGPTIGTLVIVTPHNEQIRFEFARGFNDWRSKRGQGAVQFDWRASGGTSDLRRTVLSQYDALAKNGTLDMGIGVDLFFGGGEFDHNRLAGGVKVSRDGAGTSEPVAIKPQLPDGLLDEVFPQPTIGGERLIHKDGLWIGTALSSFGIAYNRDVLTMLELPEPSDWSDLADPRYTGWVAMADPGHSSSVGAALNTVVRRQGWSRGWATLRRVYANSRYFASSASKVPVDVSSGEAAAGLSIDFYGRTQAGAIGADRVGYVDPVVAGVSQTATTADPITLLRGAPSRELAEQFIVFVLSPEGQQLWQRRVGEPMGPVRYELRRQPIRRDAYSAENKAFWSDPQIDPFPTAHPFPEAMPDFFGMVAPVSHAMAISVHEELKQAWEAISSLPPGDPRLPLALAHFDAMPPELTLVVPMEALEDASHPLHDQAVETIQSFAKDVGAIKGDELLKARLRWAEFFRGQYEQVVAICGA
jgi:ABC-type Fe3+ transport system substrate-binding protein